MNGVFADTSYFVALLQPRDQYHSKAVECQRINRSMLHTTQWVLVELANFCSRAKLRSDFSTLVTGLGLRSVVVPASDDWFARGHRLFDASMDKDWSLTDCISFQVMRDLELTEALTADHHFEQAGFTALLK